jgi:sugar fermentation stimulation protein A
VYCVAHTGITEVAPAWEVDPAYAETLVWAIEQGVEVMAYGAAISLTEMSLVRAIPLIMRPKV